MSRIVDAMAGAHERIARPQLCSVVDEQHAPGGVSRRDRPKSEVTEAARVPPIELDDLGRGNPPPFEVRSHPERRDESGVAVLERDDRRIVEMVVVIVGEHHSGQSWQVAERERRGKPSLRASEADRPDALAPHWVGEEAMSVDLEQDRRVAQPRYAYPRGGWGREAAWFYGNRARRRRGLHIGPARELVTDGRPEIVHDRLWVLEVRAFPLRGVL